MKASDASTASSNLPEKNLRLLREVTIIFHPVIRDVSSNPSAVKFVSESTDTPATYKQQHEDVEDLEFQVFTDHRNRLPYDYLVYMTRSHDLHFADDQGTAIKPLVPTAFDTRTSWSSPLPDKKDTLHITGKLDLSVTHSSIACDACGRRVVGVRYQCDTCIDYDECDSCRDACLAGTNRHYEVHPDHTFTRLPRVIPFPSQLLASTTIRTMLNIWQVYRDRPALAMLKTDPQELVDAELEDRMIPVGDAYEFKTYGQVMDDAIALSRGVGTVMSPGQSVCIIGRNSYEWICANFAMLCQGHVVVPIPYNSTPQGVRDILSQIEPAAIVTSTEHRTMIEDAVKDLSLDCVDQFIVMTSQESLEPVKDSESNPTIAIHSQEKLLESGQPLRTPLVELSPDSLETVVYTSGTTGGTKGVMFTSKELMDDLASVSPGSYTNFIKRMVLFMPLSHQSTRDLIQRSWIKSGVLALSSGNPGCLPAEMRTFQITWCGGVPRVWNALYKQYQHDVQVQLNKIENDLSRREIEGEQLLRYSRMLGPNCRVVTTGTAPISPEVKKWVIKCFYQCQFLEGYGTTEVGAITHDDSPARDTQIKLVDVPDLGYLSTDKPYPRGEIWAKNPNMSTGYYRNEQATDERFTEGGWFRTGDVAEQVPHIGGTFKYKIIDRCKALFKLAQGEYVSPENVEGVMNSIPGIYQSLLYGDSLQHYPVAVVVVSREALPRALAAEADESSPALNDFLLSQIVEACEREGVPNYEIPRALIVTTEPFSPDNGMLTASLKLNRSGVTRFYADALRELYDSQGEDDSLRKSLERVLKRVLKKDNANDDQDTRFDSRALPDLDSFEIVQLQGAIKREFGKVIPLGTLMSSAEGIDSLQRLVQKTSSQTPVCAAELACFDNGMDIIVPMRGVHQIREVKASMQGDEGVNEEQRTPLIVDQERDQERDGEEIVKVNQLERETIFVTGATGFIGAHLVARLLLHSTADVVCLVRPLASGDTVQEDEAMEEIAERKRARDRLIKTFEHYTLLQPLTASPDAMARLTVLAGDLSLLSMGLSLDECESLSERVSTIYHVGAAVNWAWPLSRLYKANVIGTQQVLSLACHGRRKVVNFVSTISVEGSGPSGTDMLTAGLARSYAGAGKHGYAVSKWLAERLARQCAKRNPDLDLRIFRPGMVTADPATGAGNPTDYTTRFLSGCLEARVAFTTDAAFEMIPVDYVVAALNHIGSVDRNSLNEDGGTPRAEDGSVASRSTGVRFIPTFNLVNSAKALTYSDVAQALSPFDVKAVSYSEWRRRIEDLPATSSVRSILPFFPATPEFPPSSRSNNSTLVANTDRALSIGESGIACAAPSSGWITKAATFQKAQSAKAPEK